jgi:hypothetical protein
MPIESHKVVYFITCSKYGQHFQEQNISMVHRLYYYTNSYYISLYAKGHPYMRRLGENLEEHPQCKHYRPLQS